MKTARNSGHAVAILRGTVSGLTAKRINGVVQLVAADGSVIDKSLQLLPADSILQPVLMALQSGGRMQAGDEVEGDISVGRHDENVLDNQRRAFGRHADSYNESSGGDDAEMRPEQPIKFDSLPAVGSNGSGAALNFAIGVRPQTSGMRPSTAASTSIGFDFSGGTVRKPRLHFTGKDRQLIERTKAQLPREWDYQVRKANYAVWTECVARKIPTACPQRASQPPPAQRKVQLQAAGFTPAPRSDAHAHAGAALSQMIMGFQRQHEDRSSGDDGRPTTSGGAGGPGQAGVAMTSSCRAQLQPRLNLRLGTAATDSESQLQSFVEPGN